MCFSCCYDSSQVADISIIPSGSQPKTHKASQPAALPQLHSANQKAGRSAKEAFQQPELHPFHLQHQKNVEFDTKSLL